MKYSLKLLLNQSKKNKRQQHPIYLRIIVNAKVAYIATGENVCPSQWDEKTEYVKAHDEELDINMRIHELKGRINRKITEAVLKNETVTAQGLKSSLTGKKDMHDIFQFVESFSKESAHKKQESTILNYTKHMNRLAIFHCSRNLAFEEVTPDFLSRYEKYLREADLGNNYVHALFKTLKTFFNAAKKRGLITDYPFDRYENPIYKAPVKEYLTMPEIKKLEKFADETKNIYLRQTAIYFLLGISTGLRVSDWYRFDINKHVRDGHVLLRAKKNGEWVTMPVNPILARNIERMKVTPLSIEMPTLNSNIKIIAAKEEVKIKKHLTTHSGRHTFAVTVSADRGLSVEVTAELLGITPKVCLENYYKTTQFKINKEVVKAWKGM